MATNKVNGVSSGGEFLGKNLDFYTITFTGNDIRALASGGSVASQYRLDRIIEIIAMNGQPILMNNPTGSGPFVLKFAIEHKDAWAAATVDGAYVTTDVLVTAIVRHQGMYQPQKNPGDALVNLWAAPLTTSNVVVAVSDTM